MALGVICTGIRHISDDIFLYAAEALADMVTEKDFQVGRMYPHPSEIQICSVKIAAKIAQKAYDDRIASTYPEPKDKIEFIK